MFRQLETLGLVSSGFQKNVFQGLFRKMRVALMFVTPGFI